MATISIGHLEINDDNPGRVVVTDLDLGGELRLPTGSLLDEFISVLADRLEPRPLDGDPEPDDVFTTDLAAAVQDPHKRVHSTRRIPAPAPALVDEATGQSVTVEELARRMQERERKAAALLGAPHIPLAVAEAVTVEGEPCGSQYVDQYETIPCAGKAGHAGQHWSWANNGADVLWESDAATSQPNPVDPLLSAIELAATQLLTATAGYRQQIGA